MGTIGTSIIIMGEIGTTIIIMAIAFAALVLCFAGLGVKLLVKRNGEFKRHCSSIDPYTGKGGGCECAKRVVCSNRKKHPYQPLEVNEEIMRELKVDN